jgi:tetratricopeptide (TPR) repeat protein
MQCLHFRLGRRAAACAVGFALVVSSSPLALRADGPARPKAVQPSPTTTPEAPPDETQKSPAVLEKLVNSAAFLEATAANGQTWRGTGWVYDQDRRLMITNMHVVAAPDKKELKSVGAWFPVVKDGEAIHDIDYYAKNVPQIPVTIIYTDNVRDLALVQLASLPQNVKALALAAKSAPVGSLLHSLGGLPRGSQGLFIYTQGTSRAVYKRGIAVGGPIQVLETQMPLNQGNSGGPIVNDDGKIVGVFEGLNIEQGVQLVNMCIDVSEVRKFLDAALPHVEPKSAADLNARGDLHYEAGRYNAALTDYNAALKLEPKNAEAISNRGWVMYQKDDKQTALAEFNAALAISPELKYARWGRATIRRDEGEYEQSLEDFTEAIRHTEDAADLANLYNERGNTHYAAEDYEAALADYDQAIAKKPDLAWAHANRGDALMELKRYDEGFPALDKAILLNNKEAQFWNIAGNAWFARERYDFAANMYGNAINLDPASAVYYRNRGGAQRLAAQYQGATEDLVKAIELAPSEDDYWNELGLAWFDAGRFDLAATSFAKAIDLDGANSTYYGNRGHSLHNQGLHEQAIADLTKAIADDDAALYRKLRGQSYQALGNHTKAKVDFAKAVELDPEYKLHDRKYIQINNNSGVELKVYVQFYTLGSDDKWHWYPSNPSDGEMMTYTFAPGEKMYLLHKDRYIKANRARVWAEGGGKEWPKWRDSDNILVPPSGYLSTSDDQDTETLNFNAN